MLTIDELIASARTHQMYLNGHWRLGQTIFNICLQLYPEFANAIRGTYADPFYVSQFYDTKDFRVVKFTEAYEEAWANS